LLQNSNNYTTARCNNQVGLTDLFHGAEPSFRSLQSLRHSRIPQHFMETGWFITVFTAALNLFPTLSQINLINTTPSYFTKSILILSYRLRLGLPSGLFPSGFLTETCTHSFSPHACYMLSPSHRRLDHSNYIWRRVQVIKLLIMKFSSTSCHFIPLRSTPVRHTPNYFTSRYRVLGSFDYMHFETFKFLNP
jgi:hypothetical protein